MEKQEHATEVPSETFWRQASTQILGALIIFTFATLQLPFLISIFLPLSYLALYMQICFCSASKSAFY